MMLKEFFVLAGRYSINKDSRYVLEFNQTAFGSPLAGKVGNQISRTVVDFCRVLENVPVQPLIDDLTVLVIVETEDRCANNCEHSPSHKKMFENTRPHKAACHPG